MIVTQKIQGVDERLRTRFSWGLTVAIEPTRIRNESGYIVEKSRNFKNNLPEDVAFLLQNKFDLMLEN